MFQPLKDVYRGASAKAISLGIMTREQAAFLSDDADKVAWFGLRRILWLQLDRSETNQKVKNVERAFTENGSPVSDWPFHEKEFHGILLKIANATDESYQMSLRSLMDDIVGKLKRNEIHIDAACDALLGKRPDGLPAAQSDQELLDQVRELDEDVVKAVERKIVRLSLPKRGTSPEALCSAAKRLRWLAGHLERQAKILEDRADFYASHLGEVNQ